MRIEDFVKENRSAFDDREVPAELWARMEKKMKTKESGKFKIFRKMQFNFSMAAGILIVLSIGYLLGRYAKPASQNPEYTLMDPNSANTLISYTSMIEKKRDELKFIKTAAPELYNEFLGDLIVLEENYKTLKAELPNNPNQEELIKAMIQNLQWQIELLNKQNQIGEKFKEKEKPGLI
ncbi:hypothetical protein GVN16_10655 [Emticicia sp. CRIBPO]|uniref:hypothetical protein n=1 Tax=Emticicia sp. CRIBPO TaxID=2683258 RepID=UPI001412CFB5|nr:hypothetical protein [Emticicia sp. CRIBPO]NBA86224.1 hypothetical protein [Emticicia sp. CRIBPO]